MKKILVIASILLFIACNSLEKDAYRVEGNITNFEEGKAIYLEKFNEETMLFEPFDTAKVKDGKFQFDGKVDKEPYMCYVQMEGVNMKAMFIMEHGKIQLTIDKDSMQNNKIGGTFNNDAFQEYNDFMFPVYEKMKNFQKLNNDRMNNAYMTNDTVALNKLQKEYMVLGDEHAKQNLTFVQKNTKAFVSILVLENMIKQQRGTMEELQKAYENLAKEVKETKPGKKVGDILKAMTGVSVGKPAPEFSGPTPDGTTISLKNSLGKLTLIDFWAAWCAPCRRENPNVVKLYNEFKDKGFQIIGVSLDNPGEDQKWKDAIVADKLTWPQISNLQGWADPIAKTYNITGIPATFLVDANGIIIAKDLRGEELRAKVAELLK
jgi:peroxiredoxin